MKQQRNTFFIFLLILILSFIILDDQIKVLLAGKYFLLHLLTLLVFNRINIIFHEYGHVVFGRIVGVKTLKLYFGKGRLLKDTYIFGIRTIINRKLKGAQTYFELSENDNRFKAFVRISGGILTHLLLCIIIYVLFGFDAKNLYHGNYFDMSSIFLISNLFILLGTIIPSYGYVMGIKIPNDGLSLLKIMFEKKYIIENSHNNGVLKQASELMQNENYHECLPIMKKLVEQYPEDIMLLINISVCQIECLEPAQAIQTLEKCLDYKDSKKEKPLILNNMADAYLMLNTQESITKAHKFMKAVMEEQSDFNPFLGTLGGVLIMMGNYKEALLKMKPAFQLRHKLSKVNHPETGMFMAFCHYMLGDKQNASLIAEKLSQGECINKAVFNHFYQILINKNPLFGELFTWDKK